VPGTIGQYGLSISVVNAAGSSWTGWLPCGSALAPAADPVGVPVPDAVLVGVAGAARGLELSEQAARPTSTATASTLAINALWCRSRLLTRTSSTRHAVEAIVAEVR
jgi:hypothetical protein